MKTSRRDFIKKLGLSAAALSLSGCGQIIKKTTEPTAMQPALSEKPNILFICTDYQSGEDGPSLGTPFLDMPALDRLCKNGVVFDRHYSTAPVCMPERYTWITGQYPHTHGKWSNGGGWVKDGTAVLMEELGKHGYYSLGIGKMHFAPWEEMAGFNRRITADRKANIEWDAKHQDDYAKFLATYGLTRWDYLKLGYESETPHIYDWPFPEECHIDHFVGSQAAQVLEKGEMDNTIIIYSADHGGMNGDHGNFHKGFIYERSANVPFVVHCPARYTPRRTQALCGGVDLMPTILSLAGAPVPAGVEGTDLSPLFSGEKETISDQTIIEIGGNIGVITDRWKLFVHRNGEGELFDFKNDPDELKNLYDDPGSAGIRAELEQRLLNFNPDFKEKLSVSPPPRIAYKNEYRLSQGDAMLQAKEPYPPPQGGKTIQIHAVIGPDGDTKPDGAFFVCSERIGSWPGMPPQNGYAVYIHKGKPAVGIRNWHTDTIFSADSPLPAGEVKIDFTLKPDGALTLDVNGSTVIKEKAPGGFPVRRGRQELLAPSIQAGAGLAWDKPIGSYDQKAKFSGVIKDMVLKVGS